MPCMLVILTRRKISCLPQEMYTAEQLDILAICFTCVKVLYVGGAIERARRLVALIEPARQAFRTPMHQTVIRNEAAFHGCIQQLLQQQMPPSLPCTPSKDVPIIYLCGDSHCLPGTAPCGSPHAAVQRNLVADDVLPDSSACAPIGCHGAAIQVSIWDTLLAQAWLLPLQGAGTGWQWVGRSCWWCRSW